MSASAARPSSSCKSSPCLSRLLGKRSFASGGLLQLLQGTLNQILAAPVYLEAQVVEVTTIDDDFWATTMGRTADDAQLLRDVGRNLPCERLVVTMCLGRKSADESGAFRSETRMESRT